MSAGRQEWQPQEVFQPSSCQTAGIDFSAFALISRRTSSWVRSVHLHIGLAAGTAKASPSVTASTCSTRPVHWPQEERGLGDGAHLVEAWSGPPPVIALTILPLHTPLHPQISASSGKAATAAIGSSAAPPA